MSKVDLAAKMVDKFYDSIMNIHNDRDTGDRSKEIHVTDLASYCIRKSFYHKKFPYFFDLPSVIRMAIGTKLHEIKLFSPEDYESPDVHHEIPVEWNGIMGTIDEYYHGIIIDKKTTRKSMTSPSRYVTKQLSYYTVLARHSNLEPTDAVVLYFNINDADAVAFNINVTRSLQSLEEEMTIRKDILVAAMASDVPPPKESGWWCKYCECATLCRKRGAVIPGKAVSE